MFDAENLRRIERVHRFAYPPTFWKRREELASLAETERFRAAYPAARLIGTPEHVWAARQAEPDLPDELIPFMIVGEQPQPDYYGFQVSRRAVPPGGEWPVLVWCIHASVHGWDAGFGACLDELQSQSGCNGRPNP
ncbi:MAG: hypothetical protein JWO38_513 [Gemmataceae bacterium]|nr:hypothetical protein [Gemmataceae bacterium]